MAPRQVQDARNGDEDQKARSDAPKSIAGSLLVPADMLPAASPADRRPNADGNAARPSSRRRVPSPYPPPAERTRTPFTRIRSFSRRLLTSVPDGALVPRAAG